MQIINDEIILTVNVISLNRTTATGMVVLKDNGWTISVQRLGQDGTTTFIVKIDALAKGPHNFVAYYAGDAFFAPSVSMFPAFKNIE